MINRVVLVGRLSQDPELKKSATGNAVCTFSVAVDDRMKNPDGTPSTSFIPCIVFAQTADLVMKFTRKGHLVGVEGRLRQRTFERKDGTKGYAYEVVCDSVQFLQPKDNASNTATVPNEAPIFDEVSSSVEEASNLDSVELPDDDLPF